MRSYNWGSLIFNLILTTFVITLILICFRYQPEIQQVHLIISIPTVLLLILLVLKDLSPATKQKEDPNKKQTNWMDIARIGGWILIFSIAIFFFGFYLSILLFCFLFLFIEGKLKCYKCLTITLIVTLAIYIFFQLTLNVVMWPGIVTEIFEDFLGGGILPPL